MQKHTADTTASKTMDKTRDKNRSSTATKLGILGVTVAGVAAAYFFLGPKGKKHQKQAKAWAIKMKGDVVERLETASTVSKAVYHEIIDAVAEEYKKSMKGSDMEIDALARDLKKHWNTVSKAGKAAKKDIASAVKRVVKKAQSSHP